MSHELICAWLGLPPDPWPPDHYALLGLTPAAGLQASAPGPPAGRTGPDPGGLGRRARPAAGAGPAGRPRPAGPPGAATPGQRAGGPRPAPGSPGPLPGPGGQAGGPGLRNRTVFPGGQARPGDQAGPVPPQGPDPAPPAGVAAGR